MGLLEPLHQKSGGKADRTPSWRDQSTPVGAKSRVGPAWPPPSPSVPASGTPPIRPQLQPAARTGHQHGMDEWLQPPVSYASISILHALSIVHPSPNDAQRSSNFAPSVAWKIQREIYFENRWPLKGPNYDAPPWQARERSTMQLKT